MSVKNRLKDFIKFNNMSISGFETEINASNGYVNSISKSIGLDKLELILEKFPNLNLEWLLTGKGEMLRIKLSSKEEILGVDYKELWLERSEYIKLQNHRIKELEKENDELKKAQESSFYGSMVAEDRPKLEK